MILCYVDESSTVDIPDNSSHFVLAGLSVPIWQWRNADRQINSILTRYGLGGKEIHTAWLLRPYLEQFRIAEFEKLGWAARRTAVERERNAYLLSLQKAHQNKTYKQAKKNYHHTADYTHLTMTERKTLLRDVAECVSGWGFARLFAECIDKLHFDSSKTGRTVGEQALEQIVSRFEQYLKRSDLDLGQRNFGLLVHDNNPTVAHKHTELMRHFHAQGTLWTSIERFIETPLFVDSALTSMVQIADLCSYALRRYIENGETNLFNPLFIRADRIGNTVVGVRHFTTASCTCEICQAHRRS
ncbi:MAG TPA: DUF3800 domain-containing protein [Candidatus Binataceae bacterium]|nr:DUF3800 domain-containing protein [Candidatus Binataceae bacterium]